MRTGLICPRRRYVVSLSLPLLIALAGTALGQTEKTAAEPKIVPEEPTRQDEEITIDVSAFLAPEAAIATKQKRKLEETPSIITVFTREDMDRLAASTLADLLQYVPGFYEVSSQLNRNFAIRGIHAAFSQHFVVMIDGLVTNDFLLLNATPDFYSLDYAERVEVIRGPGSALFGANALMGVINVVTKSGKKRKKIQNTFTAGHRGFFRNAFSKGIDLGEKGELFFSGTVWGDIGNKFTVAGNEDVIMPSRGQNISDGIQAGENLTKPRNSATVNVNKYGINYDFLGKYAVDEDFIARFNVARNDFFLQRSYRQALLNEDEDQAPNMINTRLYADLQEGFGDADKYGRVLLRQSALHFSHEMRSQRISRDFYTEAETENQSIIYNWQGAEMRFKLAAEYEKTIPEFSVFKENRVVAGVQAEYDVAFDYSMRRCSLDSGGLFDPSIYAEVGGTDVHCLDQMMLNEGLVIDETGNLIEDTDTNHLGDGDEIRVGGYLQYSSYFAEYFGIVAGLRIDTHSEFDPQISPRIALMSNFGTVYAKAQFASAFAYPAFLNRTGNGVSHFLGNPDIDPQAIRTYELLVGLKGSMFRFEVNGYYNQIRDFITFDTTRLFNTGRYLFTNQGDVDILGVEASGVLVLWDGRATFTLNGSFAKPVAFGSDDDEETFSVDGWLGGASKFPKLVLSGIARLTPWDWLRFTLAATWSASVVGPANIPASFQGIEGIDGGTFDSLGPDEYTTDTITLNSSIAVTYFKNITMGLDFLNMINRQQYRPGSVLVPYLQPGFNARATVTVKF